MRDRDTVCAICGQKPSASALHYDHDHETGEFRGWLCFRCNAGLGMFEDNVEYLAKAIAYLNPPDRIDKFMGLTTYVIRQIRIG